MTQSIILAENTGSNTRKSGHGRQLLAAVNKHLATEKVSFHTPGHKGRLALDIDSSTFACDLTEVPGLDELANPSGVLQNLQERIAKSFGARQSFISTNGASAALTAAILACASRGKKILLPVNVHRSAINALVLSGLEPIWYEPEWLSNWNSWGATSAEILKELIAKYEPELACVLVCSPNYAGVLSDIAGIAAVCKSSNRPLIVDEAHGAHLSSASGYPASALESGADLVVHSLHKTLTAPTQTGLLHLGKNSSASAFELQSALNLLQSSSPSYLFMLGIEQVLSDLEAGLAERANRLASQLRSRMAELREISFLQTQNRQDPLHILLNHRCFSANDFNQILQEKGIYSETTLGNGVLLLLGLASNEVDLDLLLSALGAISATGEAYENAASKPVAAKQVLSPRQAYFAESITLKAEQAVGKIACDWVAPCPPGYAIVAPGQEISSESIKFLGDDTVIRVVKNYQPLEGDTDGPYTSS